MLENKIVVVTGANGALGRAVSQKAESLGAKVFNLDIAFPEPSEQNKVVDLTDLAATKACFESIGEFDVLLNIAGGFTMGEESWDDSDEAWDRMFTINVATLRNSLRAAIPSMKERGSGAVVNVGAYGAREGQAKMSSYIASKSVVMRLTESLSAEVKPLGINVNAVLPTAIDTPANRADMPNKDPATWVSPDDLANVICFLSSDGAKAVHGALLPVRGLS